MSKNEFHLSGRVIKKRIKGRMVEVLVPSGRRMEWEEFVKLFRRNGKS
jgi:hypothetical protein